MITLLLSVPSWPMLFAMIKQLTVVAEPSITRMATICSPWKPMATAMGKKIAANPKSLIKLATNAGFISFTAFLNSKVAPMDIRPSGVAKAEILDTMV